MEEGEGWFHLVTYPYVWSCSLLSFPVLLLIIIPKHRLNPNLYEAHICFGSWTIISGSIGRTHCSKKVCIYQSTMVTLTEMTIKFYFLWIRYCTFFYFGWKNNCMLSVYELYKHWTKIQTILKEKLKVVFLKIVFFSFSLAFKVRLDC